MDSEKVNEIWKALKFMMALDHSNKLPYIDGNTIKQIAYEEILTYINELELERGEIAIKNNKLVFQTIELLDEKKELQDRLAELEAKIENGTLVELPCKVGDTVYYVEGGFIYELKVICYNFNKTNNSLYACLDNFCRQLNFSELNKIWFLTKDEAEEKVCEQLLGLSYPKRSNTK